MDRSPGGDLAIVIALCDGLLDQAIPAARRAAKLNRAGRTAASVYNGLKLAGSLLILGAVGVLFLMGHVGLPVALVIVGGAVIALAVLFFLPVLARRRRSLKLEEAGDEEQHALYGSVDQINSFTHQLEAWGVQDPRLEAASFVQLERQARRLRGRLLELRG